ncbi:hypothetical protein BT93_A1268 [Corymbia citriodora subsp. variegata]|nr:hypothetical protein BT93_A1268 [Corymbia citriodora subsp. variegata]
MYYSRNFTKERMVQIQMNTTSTATAATATPRTSTANKIDLKKSWFHVGKDIIHGESNPYPTHGRNQDDQKPRRKHELES